MVPSAWSCGEAIQRICCSTRLNPYEIARYSTLILEAKTNLEIASIVAECQHQDLDAYKFQVLNALVARDSTTARILRQISDLDEPRFQKLRYHIDLNTPSLYSETSARNLDFIAHLAAAKSKLEVDLSLQKHLRGIEDMLYQRQIDIDTNRHLLQSMLQTSLTPKLRNNILAQLSAMDDMEFGLVQESAEFYGL